MLQTSKDRWWTSCEMIKKKHLFETFHIIILFIYVLHNTITAIRAEVVLKIKGQRPKMDRQVSSGMLVYWKYQ